MKLIQSDKIEEGQALVLNSVQVDPGFFTVTQQYALTEANSIHEEIAREHLNIISLAEFIDEETALVANLARASISLRNFDLDSPSKDRYCYYS